MKVQVFLINYKVSSRQGFKRPKFLVSHALAFLEGPVLAGKAGKRGRGRYACFWIALVWQVHIILTTTHEPPLAT